MSSTSREQIGEILAGVTGGRFAARRTAAGDDLRLEVEGVGPLRFPVTRKQARELCRVARPARYGRGDETLLDREVRDTWEIPKSRVKIDRRRWNDTLRPVLEDLRRDLGLPDGELKAELHNMLVYAAGQFFLPHQDSEKADEMIGTLVVTLPSEFEGGAFVIEHGGEKVTYRSTKKSLAFVAFYADCRHEVRPVKEGHRIVLTYNLMLEPEETADPGSGPFSTSDADPETVEALGGPLREHFGTPLPPRWRDGPERQPPDRLVFLLDHEYTERGLDWLRLKGNDAARAAALAGAAERADCAVALALAEIHETWGCMEEGWDDPWYGDDRRWSREGDEWIDDDEPPPDGPDAYDLIDLHDWGTTLERWTEPGGEAEAIATRVDDDEVCYVTPTVETEPYTAEYTGYMGNWGNTMDRWYRRAAVVVWPRERDFAVRAEASPVGALRTIGKRIRAGAAAEARELVRSMLPFWEGVAAREGRRGFLDQALRVAEGVEDPELAAALLRPFRVEALTPASAPALVALVERYGEDWARELLSEWSGPDRLGIRGPGVEDSLAWLATLPRLCEALLAVNDEGGRPVARVLVQDRWGCARDAIEDWRGMVPPSRRDEALGELDRPILGLLEASAIAGDDETRRQASTFLCADENEPLLDCLLGVLRVGGESMTAEQRAEVGLDDLRRHCVQVLEARLSTPARDGDDWSLSLPGGCDCELCETLADFLSASDRRQLEWPIAKDRRKHVHRRIDAHELPVRHETRRSGRPYTLVLTKSQSIFEREAAARRSWQRALDKLARP